MPLGRPDEQGNLLPTSRFYRGGSGSLGKAATWICPGCGKQNDAPRRVEDGCVHCGAGDPSLNPPRKPLERHQETGRVEQVHHPGAAHPDDRYHAGHPTIVTGAAPRIGQGGATRILRLIEYLIDPGEDATDVLRRSLVGCMEFPWGTITGTIVDTADARQEDLLRLAKYQPGVWLAKRPDGTIPPEEPVRRPRSPQFISVGQPVLSVRPPADNAQEQQMTTPSVGIQYGPEAARLAQAIYQLGGPQLAHTLAMGLQAILEEIGGNSEPEKFLAPQQCLELATALMDLLPPEWDQVQERETPQEVVGGTEEDQARKQRIREKLQAASQPQPTYREVPDADR